MKKKYTVMIGTPGNLKTYELRLGHNTFKRFGLSRRGCGIETAFTKEVVGFKEAHACLRLALCNGQKQGIPVWGVVLDCPCDELLKLPNFLHKQI